MCEYRVVYECLCKFLVKKFFGYGVVILIILYGICSVVVIFCNDIGRGCFVVR